MSLVSPGGSEDLGLGAGVFALGRVPMALSMGFIGVAGQFTFRSLGPFPGYGLLEQVGFQFFGSTTGITDLGFVYGAFEVDSANTFARATPVHQAGGRTVQGVPAIPFSGGEELRVVIPVYRPVTTGSFWVTIGMDVSPTANPRCFVWALVSHVVSAGRGGNDSSADRSKSIDGAG